MAATGSGRALPRGARPVTRYRICDASGALVAMHCRQDGPDGKRMWWEQPDGTSGLGGLSSADLPLYGIDRLNSSPTVIVVEGEKAAEALLAIGVQAVGTVTGASETPGAISLAELTGRRVHVWPDADDVGRKHMQRVAAGLVGVASSVSILEPPEGVPAGWDAADAVAEGRDLEALLAGPPTPTLVEALAAIEQFLGRYVVFARRETIVAVVLWIAHTHAIERAEATPYLAISSPEKQSGKTRLLECLQLLAHDCSGIVITPTASTIYRSLEASPGATLLLDELDAVFRDRSDKYEEVRAVINAGHRRGATVPRSVPGPKNTWLVKQFPVFGPKALAGIGKLPDTVTDRAIPVRMLKRKRSEPIAKFRQRTATSEAASVVAGLAAALLDNPPALEADLPSELPDRAADAWEPLLAIADAAAGVWPARARRAAIVLHASREQDDSLGLRLLSDVRLIFDARGVERISSADLITALAADEEGPWASERSPLTPRRLARLLHPFEITSKQVRIGPTSLKGYAREAFVDAWERYLPSSPSQTRETMTRRPSGGSLRRFPPRTLGECHERHPRSGGAQRGRRAVPLQDRGAPRPPRGRSRPDGPSLRDRATRPRRQSRMVGRAATPGAAWAVSARRAIPGLPVNGRPGVNRTGHDPLVVALARYVEALHRRYPEGPEQLRREGLDGRAIITGMSDRRKDPAA